MSLNNIYTSTTRFNGFVFLLLILVCFQFQIRSQCREDAVYNAGKFKLIKYDLAGQHPIIVPTEYSGFNLMTRETIEKVSVFQSRYNGGTKTDSGALCGNLIVNIFSQGKKWAVFNYNGKQLTDFKYDDQVNYIPFHKNKTKDNYYGNYNVWEQFYFVKTDQNYGLLSREGKELSPLEYKIPHIKNSYDTVVFTPVKDLKSSGYPDCGECLRVGYNSFSFPLAGSAIILSKDNKLGGIDTTGKTTIPFKFDRMKIYNDVLEAFVDNHSVFFDRNKKEIKGFSEVYPVFITLKDSVYQSGTSREEFSGCYIVNHKEKWGCLNILKNELTKCVFSDFTDLPDFHSASNTFTAKFLKKKKEFSVKITTAGVLVFDEKGKDVTKNYTEKYEK